MATIKGQCKKCGSTYGSYSGLDSARKNVNRHKCRKGGQCELDESKI